MDNEIDMQCELKLQKVVFDKIVFERTGFKNEEELQINMKVQIAEDVENDIYKVTIGVNGIKKDEYNLEVQISGFFTFNDSSSNMKEIFLNQNAVAILMPYVRSQISLLTAQPETECVVLPPFNIAKMMRE